MPKCISVRLESFDQISPKCYLAIAFDGSEALIPASQYFGQDYDVSKSEAHWITEWILEKKELQYSRKKTTIFTKDGRNIGNITIEHHTPKKLEIKSIKQNESLIRPTNTK